MTTEERATKLEGEMGHMATKADMDAKRGDIARLSATLTWRIVIVTGMALIIESSALLHFLLRP